MTELNFKSISEKYLRSTDYNSLTESSKLNYKSKINTLNLLPNDVITAYLSIKDMDCGNATKNVYISVYRSVLTWGYDHGELETELSKLLPKKRLVETPKQSHYLKEEVLTIRNQANSSEETNAANFLVALFFTGCRPSELYNLTWEDVGEEFISIRGAKGREAGKVSRMVIITSELRDVLDMQRRDGSDGLSSVFQTVTGRKVSKGTITPLVKRLAHRASVEVKPLRATRSGLASAMWKKGYDIHTISNQLGHKSLDTTSRYIRGTMEDKARAFKGI